MFGRRRKSHCHRMQEMISPYLDDRVTSVERDAVKYHIEICEDCEWELRSMETTVQLLSRMPVVSAPRSFTLAEAPPRLDWGPFTLSSMNRLRMATVAAAISLAILLVGDFSGFLHRDVIIGQVPAEPVLGQEVADKEMPELVLEYPLQEMPEAKKPQAITEPREREGEIPKDFPDIAPGLPEAVLPIREPYPWLRPLQIASAALLVILGGANLLVWQRKKSMA